MNQLENCQARYRSNTWMGRTHTDGLSEFEPLKFDCRCIPSKVIDLKPKVRQNLSKIKSKISMIYRFKLDMYLAILNPSVNFE